MRSTVIAFLSIISMLTAGGAAAQVQQRGHAVPQPFNPLKLGKFADKLEARIQGKCVGYEFVVSFRNGKHVARAGGVSRRAPDVTPRAMSADEKFNVASVSKTITAAAVLKLLREKNISVDAPVHPHLPSTWTLGKNVKSITFRELLTHRSGIRCKPVESYENLRTCINGGVELSDKGERSYSNTGFALFRVLIPGLNGVTVPANNPSSVYANAYMKYVQSAVFAPAGLSGIQCKPGPTPGLCYQFPEPVMKGESFGDMTETNASRGWNMSARQLSKFFTTLMYTEEILPQKVVNRMRNEEFGLDRDVLSGLFTYTHGGFFPGKENGQIKNGGELGSVVINFNNGVSVAMIVNSQLGPGLQTDTEIKAVMKEMLVLQPGTVHPAVSLRQ